ncbi:MAG: threonine/serine dehydratase [Anaerolineae bacterium]|nr:threonine/serine dehydratase [Anaerolineae bacterium]
MDLPWQPGGVALLGLLSLVGGPGLVEPPTRHGTRLMTPPTLTDVLQARARLKQHLAPSPLEHEPALGAWLKLENLQPTRSFKIRGALNSLLALSSAERERGVIACSAGNHAQGVALAAQQLGAQARLVMPAHTPQRKIRGTARYGAQVILHGDDYDSAESHALELAAREGLTFISPYNHPQVVAGQGTMALEIFEQLPEVGRVIVPVGGGGMLGGIGLVCRQLNPNCEVIGVQSRATPAMYNAFYGTQLPQQPTLAEGLAGGIEPEAITLALCQQATQQIVLVEEADIAEALRWLLRETGWVAEGSAGVGVAALLSGKIPPSQRPTVVILCGGNLDYADLVRLISPAP